MSGKSLYKNFHDKYVRLDTRARWCQMIARMCECVYFCRYTSSEEIFQLVSFIGMDMVLQINDTKQSKGVFYFVGTCTLTLLTALAPSLIEKQTWQIK